MAAGTSRLIPLGVVPAFTRIEWKGVMASRAILVVVVVRDAGLRSGLAAHLSLDGHDLLTASGIGYGLLGSAMIRDPSVLVIDESVIPLDRERWIETQHIVGGWRHLVVLNGASMKAGGEDDWLVRVPLRNARKSLTDLLARWAKSESRDR